ncbi:hypothetical protein DSO57_1017666 [Entomophthora muscae]|uniref:Uncharacterized protein n=1 Tax=Entomophthora muscae TaxID=34485 RepID=A0ACC2SHL5_9FUNG|nr:hypothetical protein DSO57_1017666 [Entomophthora muscae]
MCIRKWPNLKNNDPIVEATEWKDMGITTQIHEKLGDRKITLVQWEMWRNTTTITEAAEWITEGFEPKLATPWIKEKINAKKASILKGKLYPSEAGKWLQACIGAEMIPTWKLALPIQDVAGEFYKAGIDPIKATHWADMGASAKEANKILMWMKSDFTPGESKSWMELEVDMALANNLKGRSITPQSIIGFTDRGYMLDKAVEYISKRIHITEAHPQNMGKTGETCHTVRE